MFDPEKEGRPPGQTTGRSLTGSNQIPSLGRKGAPKKSLGAKAASFTQGQQPRTDSQMGLPGKGPSNRGCCQESGRVNSPAASPASPALTRSGKPAFHLGALADGSPPSPATSNKSGRGARGGGRDPDKVVQQLGRFFQFRLLIAVYYSVFTSRLLPAPLPSFCFDDTRARRGRRGGGQPQVDLPQGFSRAPPPPARAQQREKKLTTTRNPSCARAVGALRGGGGGPGTELSKPWRRKAGEGKAGNGGVFQPCSNRRSLARKRRVWRATSQRGVAAECSRLLRRRLLGAQQTCLPSPPAGLAWPPREKPGSPGAQRSPWLVASASARPSRRLSGRQARTGSSGPRRGKRRPPQRGAVLCPGSLPPPRLIWLRVAGSLAGGN
ncbi:uncharacterized protein LOC120297247 [Crotalus tigris]|uniref:uncharacterized protein LOC120297247 n=1 Tax=Crotalus tigris TaxID=88082 RepID=UPI00192F7BE4|nr:uncharacterized protein LOC120297247 [Crotalus tigris]